MKTFDDAYLFAFHKHGKTLDDEGKLYFDAHLAPVASILKIVTDDEEIWMAGILHDTLEDTDTTYEELRDNFGKRVADLVNEVTHDGKKDSYGYYFPRLLSRDAYLIKFADRLSNLSRMSAWDKQKQAHYMRKSKFWKDGSDK